MAPAARLTRPDLKVLWRHHAELVLPGLTNFGLMTTGCLVALRRQEVVRRQGNAIIRSSQPETPLPRVLIAFLRADSCSRCSSIDDKRGTNE